MNESITLIGDSVENLANALVMKAAAAMFGAGWRFRDTKGLSQAASSAEGDEPILTIEPDQIPALHSRSVALDNLPGAAELYGYQVGPDFSVMVGNERRGLSYECAKLATDKVQVPMLSRRVNCLNVATASAVALYYLRGTRVGPMAVRGEPNNRRPEVLLLGAVGNSEALFAPLQLLGGDEFSSRTASRFGSVASEPFGRRAGLPRVEAKTKSSVFRVRPAQRTVFLE
jgi:hypothetical protein